MSHATPNKFPLGFNWERFSIVHMLSRDFLAESWCSAVIVIKSSLKHIGFWVQLYSSNENSDGWISNVFPIKVRTYEWNLTILSPPALKTRRNPSSLCGYLDCWVWHCLWTEGHAVCAKQVLFSPRWKVFPSCFSAAVRWQPPWHDTALLTWVRFVPPSRRSRPRSQFLW